MKFLVWILLIAIPLSAMAEEKKSRTPASERKKDLSFEDEVVEGLNKNPLDSLETTAKKDAKSQNHLYRKKADFRREMHRTLRESGSLQ